MGQIQELQYIFSFVNESCFDTETVCNQLRSLWTAYCLHHNLDVDTQRYDNALMEVWTLVAATEDYAADWSSCDSFGDFMCANLV